MSMFDSTADKKRKVAIAIGAKYKKQFPYKDYGAAYFLRGSPGSLQNFGPSYKEATDLQKQYRKESGFVGRGKYGVKSFVKDMRTLGLNKYTNQLADVGMGIVKGAAPVLAGRFIGRGAYGSNRLGSANANDLFTNSDKDDIILGHSEFIQNVTPTTADFETQFSSSINPGLSTFLPMLAQIAQYYEEYEMLQLIVEFRSTVVEGNDNAAGTVMMATQYNPTNPLFTNDVNLDNYSHSCASKVTENLLHGVECAEKATGQAKFEYIRTSGVPAGQDPKTYDLGLFQLATVGAYPNLQIGRLYAHYKVRLSKLKLVPTVPPPVIAYASRRAVGTSIATAALFGTSGSPLFYSCNTLDNILIENNVIQFPSNAPPGKYQINIALQINTAAAVTKALPTPTNCTLLQDDESPVTDTNYFAPTNATATSTTHSQTCFVQIPGGVISTLTYNWTVVSGADNEIITIVTQVADNLVLPNNL